MSPVSIALRHCSSGPKGAPLEGAGRNCAEAPAPRNTAPKLSAQRILRIDHTHIHDSDDARVARAEYIAARCNPLKTGLEWVTTCCDILSPSYSRIVGVVNVRVVYSENPLCAQLWRCISWSGRFRAVSSRSLQRCSFRAAGTMAKRNTHRRHADTEDAL